MEPQKTLIETIVTLGMPFMDAEAANKEVIRLTLENMQLQAKLDATRITMWDERGKP